MSTFYILLVLLVPRKPILAQRVTSPRPAEEEKAKIILIGYKLNYFCLIMRRQFPTLGRKLTGEFLPKVEEGKKD